MLQLKELGHHSSILQSNAPGRGNDKCKGPEECVKSEIEQRSRVIGEVVRDRVMHRYGHTVGERAKLLIPGRWQEKWGEAVEFWIYVKNSPLLLFKNC